MKAKSQKSCGDKSLCSIYKASRADRWVCSWRRRNLQIFCTLVRSASAALGFLGTWCKANIISLDHKEKTHIASFHTMRNVSKNCDFSLSRSGQLSVFESPFFMLSFCSLDFQDRVCQSGGIRILSIACFVKHCLSENKNTNLGGLARLFPTIYMGIKKAS